MKLITELNETVKTKVLVEGKDPTAPKSYFIEGIFLQCNIQNRNGRVYAMETVRPEIDRYIREYVNQRRALGELGHPEGPQINLDRVSHIITELTADGDNYVGKAKIMDTPHGRIVKSLIDEGVKFGVSSRGMGSLVEKGGVSYVDKDFSLATAADIVTDPSAPDAFVQGIMEGKEWVWEGGLLREKRIQAYKHDAERIARRKIEGGNIRLFEKFMRELVRSYSDKIIVESDSDLQKAKEDLAKARHAAADLNKHKDDPAYFSKLKSIRLNIRRLQDRVDSLEMQKKARS